MKSITQGELAHKSSTTKSYISRMASIVREVRFFTLRKMI
ncbi:Helix-turn-helix domain protein (fragment) [Flavobacterium psychrophilum]